ncbi:MAG: hypothetical protein M3256_06295 [Actinomycetota bacterium]|nr:hypothetical protein [Actinomycetota bacterium]
MFRITRSGDIAGYLRAGRTFSSTMRQTIGRIPDLVWRCLGLPTPPPE